MNKLLLRINRLKTAFDSNEHGKQMTQQKAVKQTSLITKKKSLNTLFIKRIGFIYHT